MARPPKVDLDPNERSFAEELARVDAGKPRGVAEAYRRAFGTRGDPKGEARAASRLAKTERVINYVSTLTAQLVGTRRLQAAQTAGRIESTLWAIATEAPSESARVAALRELRQLLPDASLGEPLSTLDRASLVDRIRGLLASELGLLVPTVDLSQDSEVVILPPSPPSF